MDFFNCTFTDTFNVCVVMVMQENWLESIKVEWFAAMAQRTLTPAATQSYVSTLSRLSTRLLAVVVNLQDEKVCGCDV